MFDLSWFITLDDETIGPLTPAQLHVFVELGWVKPETPVKHQRMRRFVPAREVRGLLPAAGQQAVDAGTGWRGVWAYVGWVLVGLVVGLLALVVGVAVLRWFGGG